MRYIIKYGITVPRINNLESVQQKFDNLKKKIEELKNDSKYFITPKEIKSYVYQNLYQDCEYSTKYNWNDLRSICHTWCSLDENPDFGKYPAIAWVYYFTGDIDTQNKIIEYALNKINMDSLEDVC